MSDPHDDVNRHAKELVRLTMSAASGEDEPLPEDEMVKLGKLIAIERQLLIDCISALLEIDEPEAAAQPGVAAFDAGFCYGLEFSRAIDDAKVALQREQRRRVLKLVRG